mmetsp:Transcript_24135/g.37377  ORF Transcript_24135/g.37377 Transcript_24135/m.37377 type:complete len:240 (-) Transcript_24135:112-831(-)
MQLAPFNPTEPAALESTLQMLQLDESDIFLDIGCGDGRVLVAAAERGAVRYCVGIENDAELASRARRRASSLNSRACRRIFVLEGDALLHTERLLAGVHRTDGIPAPTAVFVYLLPAGLRAVEPLLRRLVAGRGAGSDGGKDGGDDLGEISTRGVKESNRKENRGIRSDDGDGDGDGDGDRDPNRSYGNADRPAGRVVSYMFSMPRDLGWVPIEKRLGKGNCPIYLYDERSLHKTGDFS